MARRAAGLLDADASEQLGEIDGRLARLDSELRARINEATTGMATPAWQEELSQPAGSSVQRALILSGGRFAVVSGTAMLVSAGTGSAPLTGGAVPSALSRAFEFGTANREKVTTYQAKSRKGKTFSVTRHTARQMPSRSSSGWIAYPAAKRFGSRFVQLLQQVVVKFTYDAIDGGK